MCSRFQTFCCSSFYPNCPEHFSSLVLRGWSCETPSSWGWYQFFCFKKRSFLDFYPGYIISRVWPKTFSIIFNILYFFFLAPHHSSFSLFLFAVFYYHIVFDCDYPLCSIFQFFSMFTFHPFHTTYLTFLHLQELFGF